MKTFILLTLIFSTYAHASLSKFEGRYEVISGSDGTVFCTDYEILVDDSNTSVQLLEAAGSKIVDEFPAINKGKVSWRHEWGDVVKKGKQTNTYDGKNTISHEVRVFFNSFLFKKILLVLDGSKLTITRYSEKNEKVCVLKKL